MAFPPPCPRIQTVYFCSRDPQLSCAHDAMRFFEFPHLIKGTTKEISMNVPLRPCSLLLSVFALALASLAAIPARAAEVTLTVTAVAKKGAPPPIKKEDVQVFEGKERVQVADWRHDGPLYLAILIDDSIDTEAASQWNDLKDFTNDHALAAKALRIPLGNLGAFASPYLSLQDWLKRWPSTAGDHRSSIVMISSGIDYFRGGFDPVDPDLQTTIEHAQKANVNVWTIYYPGEGHVPRGFFRVFNSQSNLSRLSEETGAESYYLSFGRPVSLKPYFDELLEHLNNQYLLAFGAPTGGKKGKFERVRVVTEVQHVQFLTPSEVFLPPAQ